MGFLEAILAVKMFPALWSRLATAAFRRFAENFPRPLCG